MSSTAEGERSAQDGPGRLPPTLRVPTVPVVAPDFVPRPEVGRALSSAAGRVVVVAAPPGFGKTSHVAAWARSQSRPVAWIDLSPWSDDPVSLLRSVVEALSWVVELHLEALPPLKGSAAHLGSVVLPAVLDRVSSVPQPFALVIDDLQMLASSPSLDVVEAIAQALPRGSTLVLIGHAAPTSMLARMRVRPGLVEVRSPQLALDVDAASEVLALRAPHLARNRDLVDGLVAATEGWPVGVLLAGSAAGPTTGEDWRSLAADHAVSDYVLSEWLDRIDPDDRRFLLDVSCLDELGGDVCDHVAERVGSGAALRRLYADRSLLTAVNRRHERFRLLTVLRDALRQEAERNDLPAVRRRHRRAAEWHLGAGDIDAAVHHALRAGDRDFAVGLVVGHAPSVHASGRIETVARWLTALDDPDFADDPRLCLVAATNAFGRHSGRQARAWIDVGLARAAERGGAGSEMWWQLVAFGALVAPDLRLADARAAAAALPPGRWHAVAMAALGGHLFAAGEVDEAREVLVAALVETQVMGITSTEVTVRALLSLVLEHLGDRGEWQHHAAVATELVSRDSLAHTPAAALAAAAHTLASTSGDAEFATDWATARRSLSAVGSDAGWATVQARIALGRAALRHGDLAGARSMAAEAADQLRGMPGAAGVEGKLSQLQRQLQRAAQMPAFGGSAISGAELRVLHHLPSDLTLAEIAQRLYVSRNTVKSHSLSIYRKLGVDSRRACVEAARDAGLLTDLDVMRAPIH